MQSVLSVPLIVTEQSFTASLLIRVSAIVTSSPNWSKHSWKEGENFFFFFPLVQFFSLLFSLSPCRQKMESRVEVLMSATTCQPSLLNNRWGGGFWGVVDRRLLFVRDGRINLRWLPSQRLFRREPLATKNSCCADAHTSQHIQKNSHSVHMALDSYCTHTHVHTHTSSHTQIHPGVSAVSQTYHQLRPFVQFCLIGSPAACSISTLQSFRLQSQ